MSLGEVVRVLAIHWKRLLLCTLIGGVIGWAAVQFMPAYYRASLTLAPAAQLTADSIGGVSGLASRLGGLASIAGINLGGSAADKATISLETLRGATFLVRFARRHELVVPLFAGESYDPKKGTWEIDPRIYDIANSRWVRRDGSGGSAIPSDDEVYRRISKRVGIEEDRRSGILRLTVESRSPYAAVIWASGIVHELNEYLREKDIQEAQRTIDYLQRQIETTQVAEMRAIFFKLIEEQTKTLMLAKALDEYALKVIDAPLRSDRPAWPKRALLAALSAMAGLALAVLSVAVSLTPIRGLGSRSGSG